MRVALLAAPMSFEATLGDLPSDVTVRTAARGSFDVVLLFCKDGKTLRARLPAAVRALASQGALWIAWPKRTSPLAKDLSGDVVRERGLATGLVDVKVCAIDEDWSGLRFLRRKG
ncbi:MAG: DUF3052 family protein [Planctomycetes bacterium]|nr:DUF3052 family protein [Planctomycetota bacterium]MCB9920003.1 DUF3052 family protein [Planctomycetota bacterium]